MDFLFLSFFLSISLFDHLNKDSRRQLIKKTIYFLIIVNHNTVAFQLFHLGVFHLILLTIYFIKKVYNWTINERKEDINLYVD